MWDDGREYEFYEEMDELTLRYGDDEEFGDEEEEEPEEEAFEEELEPEEESEEEIEEEEDIVTTEAEVSGGLPKGRQEGCRTRQGAGEVVEPPAALSAARSTQAGKQPATVGVSA